MSPDEPPLPSHGGYRDLRAFQNSEIIYDGTVAFCHRFFRISDRTFDQMVQAARSGKQNIAEGSSVSGTSKGTELRLIGVARASLEELLNDSQDFLRQRGLVSWTKEEDKAVYIRRLAYRQPRSYSTYQKYVEDKSAETSANSMVCLINQTCFLLDRLKKQLGAQLIEEGGIRERIYRQRRTHRGF